MWQKATKEVRIEMTYSVWFERYGMYRQLCSFDAKGDEEAKKLVVSEEGEVTGLISVSKILRISELGDLSRDHPRPIIVVMVQGEESPDCGPVRSNIVTSVKIVEAWRFNLGVVISTD